MQQSKQKFILTILSMLICLVYICQGTAEARRMGGGRSFGSKPKYQRSAPAPAQNPASPGVRQNQAIGQRPQANPSFFGGRFGGMVGGLLMGGLIGSLLFGGGHGFGGPGLLDILLIGGGLFLLFRFLRARKMATHPQAHPGPMMFESASTQSWQNIGAPVEAMQPSLPHGFNEEEFLKGARAMYIRLQESWDKRDLEDIRQFTSPEVFSEIQNQAQEDPRPGKTELLLINLRLIEVREFDGQAIATVLFDVMMRENEDRVSNQVRELWHFSRDSARPDSFWTLEGIQQVE
jgi:predicted lipid-binding transport protein (Tim44 family)